MCCNVVTWCLVAIFTNKLLCPQACEHILLITSQRPQLRVSRQKCPKNCLCCESSMQSASGVSLKAFTSALIGCFVNVKWLNECTSSIAVSCTAKLLELFFFFFFCNKSHYPGFALPAVGLNAFSTPFCQESHFTIKVYCVVFKDTYHNIFCNVILEPNCVYSLSLMFSQGRNTAFHVLHLLWVDKSKGD